MLKVKVPPIKSQGIKTKLVPWIKNIVPSDFDGVWIEPFMGTGVVGFNVAPRRALMCDSNPHLVAFYQAIKTGEITPEIARKYLNDEGATLLEKGEAHYYAIRERFNEYGDSLDFLFLSRAAFNGMIRFNRKGGFNIPFCKKPNRFAQAYVTKIVNQIDVVATTIKVKDFTFKHQLLEETISAGKSGDIIYCDPPYIGRHVDYFNGWDDTHENELFEALGKSPSRFILSTWHHNDYRENKYIDSLWSKYHLLTREHFYHVGGSEKNRNPMVEALVTNYPVAAIEEEKKEARSDLMYA